MGKAPFTLTAKATFAGIQWSKLKLLLLLNTYTTYKYSTYKGKPHP